MLGHGTPECVSSCTSRRSNSVNASAVAPACAGFHEQPPRGLSIIRHHAAIRTSKAAYDLPISQAPDFPDVGLDHLAATRDLAISNHYHLCATACVSWVCRCADVQVACHQLPHLLVLPDAEDRGSPHGGGIRGHMALTPGWALQARLILQRCSPALRLEQHLQPALGSSHGVQGAAWARGCRRDGGPEG